ncbi:MAG: lytic transglycosylase domain-containing protein [Sedimentibacter sp.]
MRREKYLTTLLVMSMLSYFMMVNMSMTADAEDLSKYYSKSQDSRIENMIFNARQAFFDEKKLIKYIVELTKLDYSDCEFIVQESKNDKIDPFMVLGVLKKESNFNPSAKGIAGERGLGQLMENTAKPVAENLGYIYDRDKLFDIRYNLKLTITQLEYLKELYQGDVHKILTAYNRGQQGLVDYINSRKYNNENPSISDYSSEVLQFAAEYKEEFDNFNN